MKSLSITDYNICASEEKYSLIRFKNKASQVIDLTGILEYIYTISNHNKEIILQVYDLNNILNSIFNDKPKWVFDALVAGDMEIMRRESDNSTIIDSMLFKDIVLTGINNIENIEDTVGGNIILSYRDYEIRIKETFMD